MVSTRHEGCCSESRPYASYGSRGPSVVVGFVDLVRDHHSQLVTRPHVITELFQQVPQQELVG